MGYVLPYPPRGCVVLAEHVAEPKLLQDGVVGPGTRQPRVLVQHDLVTLARVPKEFLSGVHTPNSSLIKLKISSPVPNFAFTPWSLNRHMVLIPLPPFEMIRVRCNYKTSPTCPLDSQVVHRVQMLGDPVHEYDKHGRSLDLVQLIALHDYRQLHRSHTNHFQYPVYVVTIHAAQRR